MNIKNDTVEISSQEIDGLPKAKYSISDNVLNKVIQLEENKELQKSIKEYRIVNQALALVSKDSKYIFEEMYIKSKTKWEIIEAGMSERTFGRRKKDLIYAVDKELKKMA